MILPTFINNLETSTGFSGSAALAGWAFFSFFSFFGLSFFWFSFFGASCFLASCFGSSFFGASFFGAAPFFAGFGRATWVLPFRSSSVVSSALSASTCFLNSICGLLLRFCRWHYLSCEFSCFKIVSWILAGSVPIALIASMFFVKVSIILSASADRVSSCTWVRAIVGVILSTDLLNKFLVSMSV